MRQDTMTPEERLETVIRLDVPDRVPVAPMIYYFAARYAGITMQQLWFDPSAYALAIDKCFRDLGPWDIYFPIDPTNPAAYVFALPMKAKYPGIDLPPDAMCQFIEEEMITEEEYARIQDSRIPTSLLKYFDFMLSLACRIEGTSPASLANKLRILPQILKHLLRWRRELRKWKERGVAVLHGLLVEVPFDTFSMARGLIDFSYDLMNKPEAIREASLALSDGYVNMNDACARFVGVPRVSCLCHRTSNDFMSPRHFRDYAFPSLRSIVEKLVARGLTPILHCDGNWDKNLPCLQELPRGKVVLQLDGRTDIFRAKEILGDHCCLFGDVPSTMLAFGGQQEVTEYCEKLLRIVGKDGGFVLAAGCEIPANARPENVKAMIDAARRFGYYA
jgi:hypothetical protein